MTVALHTLVEDAFAAFEAKDRSAALQYFDADAVMIDPHYLTPHMDGKRAISEGLQWAFSSLDRLSFTIVKFLQQKMAKMPLSKQRPPICCGAVRRSSVPRPS